ncbi:MAG: dihydroorotase [Tannerellaceae bacterium]|nr:dihydroorotase [Tannerellaceae bacterium]
METILIKNATIVNEGCAFDGSVLVGGDFIISVYDSRRPLPAGLSASTVVDAAGLLLLPGVIDDHVHFREPGLTHKGSIASESAAAVAGGVTSFMDMPNTVPQTVSIEAWSRKMERASATSLSNYAFFVGATDNNITELQHIDRHRTPGVKLFMGASTGNMLVDSPETIRRIFGETGLLIAVHAEKEDIIRRNISVMKAEGSHFPIEAHPLVRSEEACYVATAEAIETACRTGARLHVLHVSTASELGLLDAKADIKDKPVTAEAAICHLLFADSDYATLGSRIKINPAVKSAADRDALRHALCSGKLDVVATDHAPHLLSEKTGDCLTAASGAPMIQHSLVAMLDMSSQGIIPLERVVALMSHRPAELYRIDRRGYIRPGYYADLTLIDPSAAWSVSEDNILYKCGWSPLENRRFRHAVRQTYVNGRLAYAGGTPLAHGRSMELRFLS